MTVKAYGSVDQIQFLLSVGFSVYEPSKAVKVVQVSTLTTLPCGLVLDLRYKK